MPSSPRSATMGSGGRSTRGDWAQPTTIWSRTRCDRLFPWLALSGSTARSKRKSCAPTMKWRGGQEQISPWPPKEREADLAGEDYFGAAGNGLSQSTIRAQRRRS